jgi:N6-adenosine-specific RNA methylase IME4
MSFTYAFKPTPAYLIITLTGVMDNLDESLDFVEAARVFNSDKSVTHVLVDERELTHSLSPKDLFTIAERLVSEATTIKKFAVAGSREDSKQRELFAGFSAVLDFRMCSFKDIEEAKVWLQEP